MAVTGDAYLQLVPRISEFYGIAIYMYWRDHNPPHIHAIYAEYEALVRIEDATIIAGSLPRTAARLVRSWTSAHRPALEANWSRAIHHEPLMPIRGLE